MCCASLLNSCEWAGLEDIHLISELTRNLLRNLRSAPHLWDKMMFPVVVSFPHHHSTSGSANSTVRYNSTGKSNFTGGAYIHTGHNVPSFPVVSGIGKQKVSFP